MPPRSNEVIRVRADRRWKRGHPLEVRSEGLSADPVDGTERRTIESILSPDVNPVAIRARHIGIRVDGPWVFDLPK